MALTAPAHLVSAQRRLDLNETRYHLRPGSPATLMAQVETLEFLRDASSRAAIARGFETQGFVIGPSVSGNEILVAASLLTEPGDYTLDLSARSESGEERSTTIRVLVEPLTPVQAGAPKPPVVLLNGWQSGLLNSCPISRTSADTFGKLQDLLLSSGAVPAVYFFDNCVECPNCLIENLGSRLGQFINSIRDTAGAVVPQVDLVGHSMGGLIARAYLAGLQPPGVNPAFKPPTNPRVRKLVQMATPNFGSFQATTLLGAQTAEMVPGSAFLWNLATWNQRSDDLRGVDSIAIAGNAGVFRSFVNASDGVVTLTSASLGFARDASRTRIVPYCHAASSFVGFGNDCAGPGIAAVTDTSHPTGQIVLSFLADSQTWNSIGKTPSQDLYLSQYGGVYFGLKTAAGAWVTDLTKVLFGSVPLLPGPVGVARDIFFQDFVRGTDTFTATSGALGTVPCGPYTTRVGYYEIIFCKFRPSIDAVMPLAAGSSGKTVASGGNITISGAGFGQRCSTCRVLANESPLSVVSWADQAITATLPNTYNGLVEITVQTTSGLDTINTMAAPVVQPLLGISLTHSGTFTQGQTGVTYTITVSNSISAGPTTGAVTVTETVPVGLTLVSMSGTGWSCSGNVCSRADALTIGASYPPITVVMNVSSTAPAQVTNQVSVSGGGSPSATASDPTTIVPAAVVPSINPGGIVNGASFSTDATISPGSISSVFGASLALRTASAVGLPLASNLGGTQLLINGNPAPLFYVSPTQVNFQLPPGVSGPATVQVVSGTARSLGVVVSVAGAAPGIFTASSNGQGQGTILNSDFSPNTAANPASAGSAVMIYCTGLGAANPPLAAGFPGVTSEPFNRTVLTPVVTVGGRQATVLFSAGAPGFVGLYQVNVVLPAGVSGSATPLKLSIAGRDSNTVTISVR